MGKQVKGKGKMPTHLILDRTNVGKTYISPSKRSKLEHYTKHTAPRSTGISGMLTLYNARIPEVNTVLPAQMLVVPSSTRPKNP